ncbi:hypothetical protein K501DRAFT_267332 [Backusella circina FSU 941]|nr:hypothetical protein K501DRAFT_267332 [Backusella circina FSU 941]
MTVKKTQARISNKRPRASIACYRCHHKKVRCDATQPECSRCKSTGIVCAYPPSRRSRSTQLKNISPFINDISHLEARIRGIESDLEKQRGMVKALLDSEDGSVSNASDSSARLSNPSCSKKKESCKMHKKVSCSPETQTAALDMVQQQCIIYDPAMTPSWDTYQQDPSMMMMSDMKDHSHGNMLFRSSMDDTSPTATRSSSLGSQSDFDFTLQPSYSTTSTSSSYSAFTDSYDQIFDYPMIIPPEQGHLILTTLLS